MCLNKSLRRFLTCVKGKIYFVPERKILQFLLNSPVNQDKPEISTWQPLVFVLFAQLKGGLGFWGACACAKQQDQLCVRPMQCRGILGSRLALLKVPKWVALPGVSVPTLPVVPLPPAGQHQRPPARDYPCSAAEFNVF